MNYEAFVKLICGTDVNAIAINTKIYLCQVNTINSLDYTVAIIVILTIFGLVWFLIKPKPKEAKKE